LQRYPIRDVRTLERLDVPTLERLDVPTLERLDVPTLERFDVLTSEPQIREGGRVRTWAGPGDTLG
jgi:hypothetical protein